MLRLLLTALIFTFVYFAESQSLRKIELDKTNNGEKLIDFLNSIEKSYNIDFIYNNLMVEGLSISGLEEKVNLEYYLENRLESIGLRLVRVPDNFFLIIEKDLLNTYGYHTENYLVLDSDTKTIRGRVLDAGNDAPLIGAQLITDRQLNSAFQTDLQGNLNLTLAAGIHEVKISYVGYESAKCMLAFSRLSDVDNFTIKMFPETRELETITITAEGSNANVNAKNAGKEVMSIESIKSLPTFMGEVDPLKSLSALPGVNTVGDLASGINVRGGETGQNLIFQDYSVIYNPTHLFGMFSGFNPDLVSQVELFKGSGPAKYGGRVSSVMDVKLRNGNLQNFVINGGVGVISSRLGIEGPIVKNKASFILSGRAAYPNWFLNATKNESLSNSQASFYDITGRLFYRIGDKDLLSFSQYYSHDDFQLIGDSTFNWSSFNSSLVWDHAFKDNFYATFRFSRSDYKSNMDYDLPIIGYSYSNGIATSSGSSEFIWEPSLTSEISSGVEVSYSLINPGLLKPTTENGNVLPVHLENHKALEISPYFQVNIEPYNRLGVIAGLRLSTMTRLGYGVIYNYDYTVSDSRQPLVTDSIGYSNGETIKRFSGLEPRISVRYSLNEQSSLKASYYRGYQYLHQVSNTASSSPQDFWISSGPNMNPQIGDQFSIGYFWNTKKNSLELSGEIYYKEVANTVDYIEGVDVQLNRYLEGSLLQGLGVAYGMEFLIKKNAGLNTGWISYTYSRSYRRFDANIALEQINNGAQYSSIFDQPHNLSIVYTRKLGKRSTLSANFKYSTGRPITIPESSFSYIGYLSRLSYSDRNEYRLPDYHRLDISLTIKDRDRINKVYAGEWVFSLFNVYARKNAYSIFFTQYGTARKLSILGSIVPSISYNFKF